MLRFIVRRLVFSVFAVIGASVIVFTLSRTAGDPRLLYAGTEGYGITPEQWEAIGADLGLDKPVPVQYLIWLGNFAKGDFGKSIVAKRPVKSVIADKLPATLKLAAAAWIVALIGLPLGVVSAVRRGGVFDYLGRLIAILGQGLPSFWVGIVAILIFAVGLGWLPSSGRGDNWDEFVLPTLTLAWLPLAAYMRLTRSSMLDVLDSEFVIFARAKGVGHWTIITKHALSNAIISPLTFSGLLLAGFITGSVVVETVFSWPGIGRLAITAVFDNDFPVLSVVVLLFTVMYVVTNLIVDVLYAVIDPRIRLA